jgi:hypothetical protein
MTHQQKVDHLIEELGQQGVGSYTVAPPFWRLLWRLGLKVPPPFFLGFRKLSLLMGTYFGVVWAVLFNVSMGVWVWWQIGGLGLAGLVGALVGAVLLVPLSAVVAGVPFGLFMAGIYRWRAARFELPSSWEDYPQA